MSTLNPKLEPILDEVLGRNAGELEFDQAVREVVDSPGPVDDRHPEYLEASILQRIRVAEAMLAVGQSEEG